MHLKRPFNSSKKAGIHHQGYFVSPAFSGSPAPPTWLERLAAEIDAAGRPCDRDTLYRQLKAFRSKCKDSQLLQSYPRTPHSFRKGKRPQARTYDFILSFMDSEYPGVSVPFVAELAEPLETEAQQLTDASELEKVLVKERKRRGGEGK